MLYGIVAGTSCDDAGPPPDPIADATVLPRECPTHLDMELIGSESRFLPGWSGTAHGVGPVTGSNGRVEIVSCDAECRRCTFRGPVPRDPSVFPVDGRRCLYDVSRTCTVDDDCGPVGADGPCRDVYPPVISQAGPLPTCVLIYFEPYGPDMEPPIQGTIDLLTGELDMAVLNTYVKVAVEACGECQGDMGNFDGIPEGTCVGGTQNPGAPCDVHGLGTSIVGSTSYDCPPGDGLLPLIIPLPAHGSSTATHQWTMDPETRPDCTRSGANKPCWCGVCDDGSPCTQNADCMTGNCGADNSGPGGDPPDYPWNTDNHNCASTCDWDPVTQTGTCAGSGTSCYPDTGSIVARGESEVRDGFYVSEIANLLCMPAFGDSSVDPIGGFPGPLLFEARYRVTPRAAP
jgi:hypothetical protein